MVNPLTHKPTSKADFDATVVPHLWQGGNTNVLLNGSGAIKRIGSVFELSFRRDGSEERNPLERVTISWENDHIQAKTSSGEMINVPTIMDLAQKLSVRSILQKPLF